MTIKKISPDENFSKKFGLSARLTPKKIFFEKNYSNLFCRAFQADHFGILFDGFNLPQTILKTKIRPILEKVKFDTRFFFQFF